MKILLACVMALFLVSSVIAENFSTISVTDAPQIAFGAKLATIKTYRGPFGQGFLGTDNGWILYVLNANGTTTILGSGNGTFDGSGMVAMIGGGVALGGMNALAASMVRPARVNGGNASASQSQSQAQAQSQNQNQSNFNLNTNINTNKGGWIPPGHNK